MNRQIRRRSMTTAVTITLALGLVSGAAAPSSAAANYPLPNNVSCGVLDFACKDAKAWYTDFWNYSVPIVSQNVSAATLDGLRKLSAMAVGGAYASAQNGILSNIDQYLVVLNRTKTSKACAMRSLYSVADDVRRDKKAIGGVRAGFKLIKSTPKVNQVLKTYAKIGYESMAMVQATAQLARAKDLYNLLIDCS